MSISTRLPCMSVGVRRGYMLLALYIIEVIKDLGTKPSLEKLMVATERQGEIIARDIIRKIPEGLTPIETGEELGRHEIDNVEHHDDRQSPPDLDEPDCKSTDQAIV